MIDSGRYLLSLMPRISRARGFRLYGADGRRLVDLWQYGGAAVLGHNPAGVLTSFKDTASRGLFAPFPHAAGRRLEKALLRLFPERAEVRLYADAESADAALREAAIRGGPLAESLRYRDFPDPAFGAPPENSSFALWRPWIPDREGGGPQVLAPVIPLPWPQRPIAFVLVPGIDGYFPPSDILSPVILAAACRAVDDLVAALPLGNRSRFPRVEAALSETDSKWRRRGPYLRPEGPLSGDAYAGLFGLFLKGGFLLSPDSASPAILPLELSPGEDAALAALLRRSSSEIL